MTDRRPQLDNLTPYASVPEQLLQSYHRHLRASQKRPSTIDLYLYIVKRFAAYCGEQGFPPLGELRREHVEAWIVSLADAGRSGNTQRDYAIWLRQWFVWLLEEGEVRANPMERVKLPAGEETEKDVVAPAAMLAALDALRKAKNWRDLAILELLYDTGMRVGECSRAVQDDLDFDARTLRLRAATTKGKRERVVALSDRCIADLDRYLRKRTDSHPELFVGRQGPLTRAGIYRVVRLAFPDAGATIGPHDIRHTSASHISASISEADMLTLFGWKNSKEARRYTKQAAQANAIAAHRQASPLERLGR